MPTVGTTSKPAYVYDAGSDTWIPIGPGEHTHEHNHDSAYIAKTLVDAKGDILTATAADTPAILTVGANDTVLTADSSTATGLKWAAASAGGYTELATGTLSGASVTISNISGSYKDLILYVYDYVISSTGGAALMRINGDTSAIYYSTGVVMEGSAGTAVYTNLAGNQEYFTGYGGNSTQQDNHSTFIFYNYANTTAAKNYQVIGTSFQSSTSRYSVKNGSGTYQSTSAITSLLIASGSNSFTAGTYYLYGVK